MVTNKMELAVFLIMLISVVAACIGLEMLPSQPAGWVLFAVGVVGCVGGIFYRAVGIYRKKFRSNP